MGVVEESKRLYSRIYSPELLAEVDTWDEGYQAYFWTYTYERMTHELNKSVLKHMEEQISRTVKRDEELSPTPFKDAEELITPHGWFGRTLAR